MKLWNKVLTALSLVVCTAAAHAQSSKTVLVVGNAHCVNSVKLVDAYMSARGIPRSNRLLLNWDANDNADSISLADYQSQIANPVRTKLQSLRGIDYIVICRNLPVKITDTSGSVDSALAANGTAKISNCYYGAAAAFSAATFGFRLVTRLDGWSWADAFALVNRGQAIQSNAPFAFDSDPTKNGGYLIYDTGLRFAGIPLRNAGFSVISNETTQFIAPSMPVAGYASWGSNDSNYNAANFAALRFAPGAIAETLVSTSASNLRYPGGGQSQIALLIHNGVTGVKGYVSEPLVDATARPTIMFPNYVAGRNLAEAFYSASPYLGWKDVVIGDPLCAPYRTAR